jgi:hypothetical protein
MIAIMQKSGAGHTCDIRVYLKQIAVTIPTTNGTASEKK